MLSGLLAFGGNSWICSWIPVYHMAQNYWRFLECTLLPVYCRLCLSHTCIYVQCYWRVMCFVLSTSGLTHVHVYGRLHLTGSWSFVKSRRHLAHISLSENFGKFGGFRWYAIFVLPFLSFWKSLSGYSSLRFSTCQLLNECPIRSSFCPFSITI